MRLTIVAKTVNISFKDAINLDQLRALAEHGLTLMKARITLRHRAASGRPLKPYSTNPIHVAKTPGLGTGQPLVRPVKVADRANPAHGGVRVDKKRKSVFYPGGYAQFRAAAGRGTLKDLILSGNLMRRLRVKIIVGNAVYIGWASPGHERIAQALDDKEDQELFAWSDEEIDEVADRAVEMVLANLK